MKKNIAITCLASLVLVILMNPEVIDSLVLFLLVGVVPGTNYVVPSSVMLIAIFSIVGLLITRFAALELFYMFVDKRSVMQKNNHHKKRMPKRRYSEI